jgi:hypothetical protein
MGAGARRPGSTVPPQGGKGGVGPTPQVPPQGGKTPVTFPRGVGDSFPTPPGGGYPPVPAQGGKGGVQQPVQPSVPAQGGKGNMPLPADYQSRYGNYGFDSGLQNYLDQQYVGSTRDAGVGYQYDPSTQTFTGGTMGGRYNPIPLSVMQQAAAGNRDVLNPYFQSNFPQQPTQVPAQGGKAQTGQVPVDMRPFVNNMDPSRPFAYYDPAPPKMSYGSVQEQNDAAARDRAARGIVGFEGPNYTGQPTQSPLDLSAIGLRGGMLYGGGNQPVPAMPAPKPMQPQPSNATTMLAKMINDQNRARAALPPQPVKPAPQGIAQIQQFLKQQEMLRGRK